jgi:hypothetical protein
VKREKLTNDIDVSINIDSDLFEIGQNMYSSLQLTFPLRTRREKQTVRESKAERQTARES